MAAGALDGRVPHRQAAIYFGGKPLVCAFKLNVIVLLFVMILTPGNGLPCVMICINVTFIGEGKSKPSEASVVPLICCWIKELAATFSVRHVLGNIQVYPVCLHCGTHVGYT